MEFVASQKPGSPLAILQQPTQGFNASTVAVSPPQTSPPQNVSPFNLEANPISIAAQAPSSADPNFSSTTTQNNHKTQPARSTSFRDLQSHWSQPFVEVLAARGIISGYTDGTFQPDRDIQASHFSLMLNQAKLYRLKVLQRELGIIASSAAQVSPPSIDENLQAASLYPTAETEAALLINTHDIRTRAQAAVFIYRNLQAPLVSTIPATEKFAAQVSLASIHPGRNSEPTFSESEEKQKSPGGSDTFQWPRTKPNWVAQDWERIQTNS